MATNLNLNSLTVDSSGRASFSGLGTGIDFQGAVDSIIKAKHAPIDRIEQKITDNQAKIAALQDLRTHALALQTAADKLRGKISFDGSANIFEAKQAFATASRADSQTPSSADSLVGVTVTNAAQATTHTIEVQQIAIANKVASGSIAAGLNDPLGVSGSFQINGQTITADPTDTVLGLRDRINAANAGASPTGVTASIVSISATEQVLILTADKTGTDAAITAADTSGSVLQDLGVIDGTGAFQAELQPAQNARILVDGLGTTVERQSNTIDDAFAGVTLNLFKAEPGTTVKVDVERDLNQVKSAIVDFVDAYNELRTYINQQARDRRPRGRRDRRRRARRDQRPVGCPLAALGRDRRRGRWRRARSSRCWRRSASRSRPRARSPTRPRPTRWRSTRPSSTTPCSTRPTRCARCSASRCRARARTRSWPDSTATPASPPAAIRSTSPTRAARSSRPTSTARPTAATTAAWQVSGNVLKVISGGAKGLQMLYNGTSSASGIHLDLSVGVGAKLYNAVGGLADDSTGLIANEVNNLQGQNDSRPGSDRPHAGAARSRARPPAGALRRHGDRAHDHEPAARQPEAADQRGVRQQRQRQLGRPGPGARKN